jgi:hypothetical protein
MESILDLGRNISSSKIDTKNKSDKLPKTNMRPLPCNRRIILCLNVSYEDEMLPFLLTLVFLLFALFYLKKMFECRLFILIHRVSFSEIL